MIMEVGVRVPKGGVPFKIFRDRLFAGLEFLHKYGEDPTIAFLPKQDDKSKGKPPLLAASDFPQVQCHMRLYYFSFPNTYSFSEVKNDKGRRIVFSTLMGFNTNPEHYLAEMAGDLDEIHCSFTRKTQQAMEVENAAVFWGAPQYMCKADMKLIADSYLKPLELEMMKEDPYSFPAAIHAQPWPEYAFVLEQPVSFERQAPGEWKPFPPLRRAIHLQCAAADTDRLTRLISVAKSKTIWLNEFGKCFPSEVSTRAMVEADSKNYSSVLNSHMAAIYSYGASYVPGLLRAREKITVECLPDAKGRIKSHTLSAKDLLQEIEFNGKKVFQCVLRSDGNRRYQVYYKGKDPLTCAFVREFLKCPAAQAYFFLLKRGVKKNEADKFVRKCFDHTQLSKIKHASYNRTTKLAVVKLDEGEMDIVTAAREDDFIDEFGHLDPEEIKATKKKLSMFEGLGDPALYDFDNGQDVTSIHGGRANGPQTRGGISIGDTKYSLYTSDTAGDMDDDGEKDDDVEFVQTTVTFAQVGEDGVEKETLDLPAFDNTEDTEGISANDDSIYHTLAFMLWLAAPNDLRLLEQLLDQLEAEQVGDMDGVEITAELATMLTEGMRTALVHEAAAESKSTLEYIDELRKSLHATYGKSAEDMEEDGSFEEEMRNVETASQTSLSELPDLDKDLDELLAADPNRFPQGSTGMAGSTLSVVDGHGAGTSQTGGVPG